MSVDFVKLLEAAEEANKAHGVDIRGKRYTPVAIRVDLFRRFFGGWGIETEVLEMGHGRGDAVVMRCKITDEVSRVVATGTAHEIVGQGSVNTTSALENAETSAIGRALAALGIHGGEFASVNEIDGAERNAAAQQEAEKARKAEAEKHEADCLHAIKTIEETISDVYELKGYWTALAFEQPKVARDSRVRDAKDERKAALLKQQKEAAE